MYFTIIVNYIHKMAQKQHILNLNQGNIRMKIYIQDQLSKTFLHRCFQIQPILRILNGSHYTNT